VHCSFGKVKAVTSSGLKNSEYKNGKILAVTGVSETSYMRMVRCGALSGMSLYPPRASPRAALLPTGSPSRALSEANIDGSQVSD
jgi:hypothetical protein